LIASTACSEISITDLKTRNPIPIQTRHKVIVPTRAMTNQRVFFSEDDSIHDLPSQTILEIISEEHSPLNPLGVLPGFLPGLLTKPISWEI
jgi:hypothetical protein